MNQKHKFYLRQNKTKSLIGPIGSFQNSSINVFVNLPSNSEKYQIENPKLQNMMQ